MATKIKSTKQPREQAASINFKQYAFTVLITPNDPDGYLVTCPPLPGLVTEGDTIEEARAMAADAVQLYLESLIERGLPVPEDSFAVALPVTVKVG